MFFRIYLTIVFMFIFSLSQSTYSKDLSFKKQADMLIKVLGYDRTVMNRESDAIRIGIIYAKDDPNATTLITQVDDIFFEFVSSERKVGDKKITYSLIAFSSEADLLDKFKALDMAVLYVLPGNDNNLAAISKVAKEKGVLTYSGVSSYIEKGIAVSAEDVEGTSKVVINLPIAKSVGSNFKAALLKVSKVIQ